MVWMRSGGSGVPVDGGASRRSRISSDGAALCRLTTGSSLVSARPPLHGSRALSRCDCCVRCETASRDLERGGKAGVAPRGSPFCTANSIGSCRDWLNPSPQPRIAYSGVEEVGGTVIASSDYDKEGCGLSRIKSPTSAPSPCAARTDELQVGRRPA
jgi:hypothetical protein